MTVKSVQASALEDQFTSLMGRLAPQPEITAEFSAIAAHVWDAQQKESARNIEKLTARLEERRHLKSELLHSKLRGEVCQSDYEQYNGEFSREIREIEKQLGGLESAMAGRDRFVKFCELAIMDIPGVWRKANEDQRRRVLTILFPEGISVGADRKISNPQNCALFNVLAGMMAQKTAISRVGCPPGIRTPIC